MEKNNDDCQRVHLNKSNKWDAAGDVLLVSKRVETLSQFHRTPRAYHKRKAQYCDCQLKEKRAKHKGKINVRKKVQLHVDSNDTPNIQNMSPKDLREGLKKIGIKTHVRNVKRLQEMFQDALRNTTVAV